MLPALRIIADVAAYRLRRLEMANLAAVVALMLALRLPLPEILLRTGFSALLNLFAYLNNDFCDIERDLAGGRDAEKTRFLAAHRSAALAVQCVLLAALLAVAALVRPGLALSVVLGGGLCVLYSAWLKRVPFVDVVAMAAWGMGMTLVAFPLSDPVGWVLVVQLGLFSAVFETIQVIRDEAEDRRSGIRTTAVQLGTARTLLLARACMFASALYGILVVHRIFALIQLGALAIPFTTDAPARFWTSVRLVLGVSFLCILASVFWTGRTAGLLVGFGY
jgi:4-hydroxybenzoate polyprenyltransferase